MGRRMIKKSVKMLIAALVLDMLKQYISNEFVNTYNHIAYWLIHLAPGSFVQKA